MTEINCDALKKHILSASGKETLTPKEELSELKRLLDKALA